MSKIQDLEKLQHLKESGVLTDEEFEKEKRIILSEKSQNFSNKVKVNKKIKPKIKLKEKKKTILCIIGVVCLLLIGLYVANRKQINEFIIQHKINTFISNATKPKEQKKEKNPKFKFKHDEIYDAIINTRTLEGNVFWQYTDTSRYSSFEINQFSGSSIHNERHSQSPGKYATYDYIKTIQLNSSNANTLSNNISQLIFRKSSTGGRYDVLGANQIGRPQNGKETVDIMALIPGLNITTNSEGIVTSISYCSNIISPMDNNPISYKSYPFDQYMEKNGNLDWAYEKYIPQFVNNIQISDIMRYLNYKNSEYDINKDFTLEQKDTDIEFYSVHRDGSLELECISKTGSITTIKFN